MDRFRIVPSLLFAFHPKHGDLPRSIFIIHRVSLSLRMSRVGGFPNLGVKLWIDHVSPDPWRLFGQLTRSFVFDFLLPSSFFV